jgi:hypothetical protein
MICIFPTCKKNSALNFSISTSKIHLAEVKSSQVNTLPNAKSQSKDKRAKDRQKYAALR